MYLRFASEASVIFDGKTVGFILQTGDHVKCLSIFRKFHFFIVKIQTSGSVVVILYHAADRNVQMQLVKNLQSNVDLSLTTIHHKDVRIDLKTFIGKSSCQNFTHTGVVIRSVDRS